MAVSSAFNTWFRTAMTLGSPFTVHLPQAVMRADTRLSSTSVRTGQPRNIAPGIWQSEKCRDGLGGLVGSHTAGAGCRGSGLTIRAFRSGSRLRGLGAAIEYTVVQTVQRQFQAIRHAQLVIHLAQVVFYYLLGGSDAHCDFLVFHSLRHAGNNERLLGCELHFRARRRGPGSLRAIGRHHPMNALAVEPRLALRYLAQAVHQ